MYVGYDGATETIDALIGAWTAGGGLLDAIIDGQITGGSITIPLIPNGAWKDAPAVGNNANQVMVVNYNNDFNSYATDILIPTYKESILTATRVPDLTDVAFAAWNTFVVTGYLTEVFGNSRDLHDLNAVRSAFLTTRKVRNQRRKTIVTP